MEEQKSMDKKSTVKFHGFTDTPLECVRKAAYTPDWVDSPGFWPYGGNNSGF